VRRGLSNSFGTLLLLDLISGELVDSRCAERSWQSPADALKLRAAASELVAAHGHVEGIEVARLDLGAQTTIRLVVEDHGAGIPQRNGATSGQGTGLVAMRERAELLHGRIEFVRPGDKGTLVRLEIPLGEDTAA